ncbi:anaerobic sulfatase maturase [Actinobacillus seminis]|uniref:Anaerobic sulfatase maturase n=1 Tax=Actinobacillus seminis TaxID=722 RepID=A0A263HCJ0_9PAST|nr:anaerobic sulfatase maturase [Actinobacillus seminis]OZN25174.1 anaerobic sulfatase maturase [Actinobacillus seminis]SUU33993.1 Anaerobic sulfatase-maturating enzyme homolog YdeM [Actinobacillus seminis]
MSFFSPQAYFHLMAKPSSFHCNIQCEYCFYLQKEKEFGVKTPFMSLTTLRNYVKNYIESHAGERVEFTWQGGEPTLLGVDFFKSAVIFQREFANGKQITNAFQTNGLALNHQWVEFFKQHQFLIGLSIDGIRAVHNRYRISRNGNTTFDKVVTAMELLKEYQVDFNTLTVVNDQNWSKGKETYLALKSLGANFMQFIPLVERQHRQSSQTTDFSVPLQGFGYFLTDVFREWQKQDIGSIFVLEFDSLLGQYLGYPSSSCVHQPSCGKSLVVEANGDVYSCDHFVCPKHKLGNLNTTSLKQLVLSPQQQQFGLEKLTHLTSVCQQCNVRKLCHGGCPKHRFIAIPNEDIKHNYLCASYRYFLQQTAVDFQQMSQKIHIGVRA